MKIFYNHVRGEVEVAFSLDLAPEVSLRILCNGADSTAQFVTFLRNEMVSRPAETVVFVESFFCTLADALDLSESYLPAKPESVGGPLDFPRPSPSWLMLKLFVEGLSKDTNFGEVLSRCSASFPRYIFIRE